MTSQLPAGPHTTPGSYRGSRLGLWRIALAAISLALVGLLVLAAAQVVRGRTLGQSVAPIAKGQGQGVLDYRAAVASVPPTPNLVEPAQAVANSSALKTATGIQQVDGVSVELSNIKRDGERVVADICFQLPSAADWQAGSYPDDVVLTAGAQSFAMGGGHLINWRTSATGAKTYRCDELHFSVPASTDVSSATLTVKRLITSTPEAMDCARLQGKLTSAATGIVIQCDAMANGMTIKIVQKPAALSNGSANRLVDDSGRDIVYGPWAFVTGVP